MQKRGAVAPLFVITSGLPSTLPASFWRQVVANILEWNVLVPYDRIKVRMQDRLVTLSGEVDFSKKVRLFVSTFGISKANFNH